MKLLLYDHGENTHLAELLAMTEQVGYHCPRTTKYFDSAYGKGLRGVEKIDNFWSVVEQVDTVMVFGSNMHDDGGLVNYLKQQRKLNVFGAGSQDTQLEWDRSTVMKMQINPQKVTGVDALLRTLKGAKDKVVKVSGYRDTETFIHDDWDSTLNQHVSKLLDAYGTDPAVEFIVTDKIKDKFEPGADDLYVNGSVANLRAYGYEDKDNAYIGKIVKDDQMPQPIAGTLPMHRSTTFASIEYIGGHLTDITMRVPYPPGPAMCIGYDNIIQWITSAAMGSSVPLVARNPYMFAVMLYSPFAKDHPVKVEVSDKNKFWLRLSRAFSHDGGATRYVAPNKDGYLGCLVYSAKEIAVGVQMVQSIADDIKAKDLTFDLSSFDTINKSITQGRSRGIPF